MFKLDYMHYTGSSVLELSWSGNFTPSAVVPADSFTSSVTAHEQQRIALRDRMQNPAQPWQTYNNPTMGTHVHMPESFAVDATLCDLTTTDVLGDIIVFRGGNPAATYVGAHSYSGSVFTEVQLDRWGPRDCSVLLQTTVVGTDLQFLATSNGSSCSSMALLISPLLMWQRAGNITAASKTVTTATVFGFPDVFTVTAVGATPVPFSKGSALSWALPLAAAGATAGVVGYSTGEAPLDIPAMQAAIAAARAVQMDALQKWGPELSPVYEPQATILAWNTMFTPYEGACARAQGGGGGG
jgi:hypothetical protein